MFVTIEIDADIKLASVCVPEFTPKYWVASVTLILFTFEVIVGNEPVPFSNMFIILSKLPDICFANEDDIITEDVNWFVFVIFTNESVFFTNIGKEPVPFSTISKTISKLLFEAVRYVDDIDAVVM